MGQDYRERIPEPKQPQAHFAQICFNDDIGWHWGARNGEKLLEREGWGKGDEADEEAVGQYEPWLTNDFLRRTHCPFCSLVLSVFEARAKSRLLDEEAAEAFGAGQDPGDSKLWVCSRCSFWQWHGAWHTNARRETRVPDFYNRSFAVSELRSFNPKLPNPVAGELAEYLRRNPGWWHTMPIVQIERLVADIFKANYARCEVMHTGQSGDGGKDVLLTDTGDEQWLISVKRRERADASEGVGTLRDLLGAMVLHDTRYGVIVSTADHFTTAVAKSRRTAGDHDFTIELLDRGKLDRLIGSLLPRTPWKEAIEYVHPDEASEIINAHGTPDFGETLSDLMEKEPKN